MQTYTRDEVRAASLAFFSGDEMPADVYVEKYALRDSNNNFYESNPAETAVRLAKEFARADAKYPNPLHETFIYSKLMNVNLVMSGTIYESIDDVAKRTSGYGEIIPQGSPMSAMGNHLQVQSLSNCFVIDPPQDSYGGILHSDQEQVQIMKRRGGVGFDVSLIRPKGQATSNAARTTDGIGVFMERFSNTCREVAQGGRRGALMLTISIKHPEIETFINIKRDKTKVTGANISIRTDDAFMQAVQDDDNFILQWPVDVPLDEAKITKVVKARDIWEQIIDAAWYSAEPGILFWDTATKMSPADAYSHVGYASKATNPCAELILSAYDSCRLQIVDLRKFVDNPWTKKAKFNFKRFEESVKIAQRLLDNLVDLEIEAVDRIIAKIKEDPESEIVRRVEIELWEKIKKAASGARRTGLGITALGDTLAMVDVKYGSKKSIVFVESIYKALALASYKSSIELAEERGAFPVYDWEVEKDHPFLKRIYDALPAEYQEKWKKFGRRNIANLTTAPVGSISMCLKSTSGIECLFSLQEYTRRRKVEAGPDVQVDFVDDSGDSWQEYKVYHQGVQDWVDATGETGIQKSPYAGACASDFEWESGVALQAAAQKWVCHSISRTANLPKNATHKTISQIYMTAWESGCKGFTVYRDESRSGVLLTGRKAQEWMTGIADEELQRSIEIGSKHLHVMPKLYIEFLNEAADELLKREEGITSTIPSEILVRAPQRPKRLPCDLHRARVMVNGESETYLVLVGLLDDKPYEIFCGLSKHVDLPRKYEKGWIVKNGRKKPGNVATYNLAIGEDDDEIVFRDIVEQFDNPMYGAFSRTLSLALRHGIPIQYITEQIQKDKNSGISSWSRAIARMLKNYIPDGTTASTDKVCPECDTEGVVYQQSCPSCMSCGWTKCM